MQYQERFAASLDVPENIVVLCPTCHRKFHHGLHDDKKPSLKLLHEKRAPLLDGRGLKIDPKQLLDFYSADIDED
jgi:5-methylcytosine-specific restriction protein A